MNFRGSMGVRIISGCCAILLRSKGTLSYVPSTSELEPRDGKQCMRILEIVYDEKNNAVLVSGPLDPEQLKRKLLCKFPKIINGIKIRPPKENPKQPVEKTKDENEEKFMRNCLEEYKEISKCIEKCKKECEEKCRTECENKFKCKCKRKCKCDCDCDCEKKKELPKEPTKEQPKETPKETKPPKEPPKPPMYPWPPLVVCCARPCPCLTAWSNNYRCCSCGVESWPEMRGPGWGSGPSHGGRPQWSNCESSQPPNIIFQSAEPSCSIM
ncbi:hypothetical protein FCM35_KLT08387 [Carex littledalei]|uniref:Uncharacterized protein n=1 Tax=Carex littledalei TaxID=544730 RepID=A0A833V6V2_9POAL|nr:hypothetical protein FCM35_KLT08387 [Carex littledalei]